MNHFSNYVWLSPSRDSASPIIRRIFQYTGGRAVIDITGLGFYELSVNGERIGDEWFQPLATDYFRREFTKITYPCHDTFTHRIYYHTCDITAYLQKGENILEIQLGNGYFVQKERIAEGKMSYADRPICHYRVTVDGNAAFGSDGSETWQDSEITYSNLFIGEVIDPESVKNAVIRQVEVVPSPETELCPQIGTPDRTVFTLTPTCIGSVGGRLIYDVGENISGVVKLFMQLPKHARAVLTFAENLNADGSLNYDSTGVGYRCSSGREQKMTDVFVSDGSKRSYQPKFVWHAFRYFDIAVEGLPEAEASEMGLPEAEASEQIPAEPSLTQTFIEKYNIYPEVSVIHADTPRTSSFQSDSEGMNFLFDAYVRTQQNNMHCGFPSDCPHRERLGYTGDGQICASAAMLLLDSREFYRKWIRDILDCQDKESGHIQHTAPFQGGGGGPGGWGSAVITVPYAYYKQYGELSLVRDCYLPMKRWIAYLKNHTENGLIVSEAEGGWCLGDWCMLPSGKIPEAYVNTCWYVVMLRRLCEMAAALGYESDIPEYRLSEAEASAAVGRCLADMRRSRDETHTFGKGTALTYAAWIGLADTAEVAAYYDALGHFDTGFLATDILTDLLFRHGYGDVAAKLICADEIGGFLYMKRHGATTVWENWDGGGSHNHPMFGAAAKHLFDGLLGIRQTDDSVGWNRISLNPYLPSSMNYASGSILTPKGRISVTLSRNPDGKVVVSTVVPQGITVVS